MIFTNSRAIIQPSNIINHKKNINNLNLNFQKKKYNRFVKKEEPIVSIVTSKDYIDEVSKRRQGNTIKWGEPFWNLFHVLAEKIDEKYFHNIRTEILNVIYTICSNLPCPECTKHAVNYLNNINFNTIHTKEDLKVMLFNFHNNVNMRKQYPLFPRHILEEKYSCANTLNTVNMFLHEFSRKQKSFHLISDNMQRKQQQQYLHTWFQQNIHMFQA